MASTTDDHSLHPWLQDHEQHLILEHPHIGVDTLDRVLQFQSLYPLPEVSNETCLAMGLALMHMVKNLDKKHFKPVVIDIELGGMVVFHYAMPGSVPDNADWIERKKRTVKRFGVSSYYLGRSLALEKKSWSQKYDLDEGLYAAHGGCCPILTEQGVLIGTVTMSGLAQVFDHILVSNVIRIFAAAAV